MTEPRSLKTRSATVALAALAVTAQLACGRSDRKAEGEGDRAGEAEVRVTGCLERGTIPGSFVLSRVTPAADVRAGGDTAAGTGGQSDAAHNPDVPGLGRIGASYTLRSGDGTNLGNYVGKRVEVSGRFADGTGPKDAVGTGGTSPPRASGPEAGRDAHGTGSGAAARDGDATGERSGPGVPERQLTADEIREVSGTCPAER